MQNSGSSRSSGIELLRMVCMLFILAGHVYVHGYKNIGLNNPDADLLSNLLMSFFTCAVDCFVLISGWFSIRLKFKSVWNLFSVCCFYGLAAYFLHLFVDGQHLGRSIIYNGIFPFSNPPGWWFIREYFYLLLISPVLNYAIASLDKVRFRYVLVLLTVFNLYFGFLWRNDVNSSGYCLCNFIWLYFIGRYLRLHCSLDKPSAVYFVRYLITCVLLAALCFAGFRLGSDSVFFDNTRYNTLVMLAAIWLFCTFARLNFHSGAINWLASSALAAYLITDNNYIGGWYYPAAHYCCSSWHLPVLIIAAAALFLCIVTDKVRFYIFRPLNKLVVKLCDKYQYLIPE